MSKAYFKGSKKTRGIHFKDIPPVVLEDDPKLYFASPELAAAVNVAITLGMPLLLSGEPGSGKSQLARRIAWELHFPEDNPLKYTVRSTTEARDLFYTFDTVGRYHAGMTADKSEPGTSKNAIAARDFIHYSALGMAILRAKGQQPELRELMTDAQFATLPAEPQRSVVLIDEIDKAPREVPNDILNEIEAMEFPVPELNAEIRLANSHSNSKQVSDHKHLESQKSLGRPIVIITSNGERDLPDAFLRRCVYFHVGFPDFVNSDPNRPSMEKIVLEKFAQRFTAQSNLLNDALALCKHLREEHHDLGKKPSLAEYLRWFDYVSQHPTTDNNYFKTANTLNDLPEKFLTSSVATILLSHAYDQQRVKSLLESWPPLTDTSATAS